LILLHIVNTNVLQHGTTIKMRGLQHSLDVTLLTKRAVRRSARDLRSARPYSEATLIVAKGSSSTRSTSFGHSVLDLDLVFSDMGGTSVSAGQVDTSLRS
jgi:hypothetical protein